MDSNVNYEEEIAKLRARAALSPEELAKKMEEAQKAAQAAFDKLSPEEQQRAQEEAQKMMKEMEEKQNAILKSAQEISASKAPKFCPNCGAPNNGTKFCTSCGNKF